LAVARPPVPASLVTDLYELTMAAAYQAEGIEHEATFELFVRRMPPQRRFLVAAGLDDAVDGLEALRFAPHEVDYLAGLGLFPDHPWWPRASGGGSRCRGRWRTRS
jgi:nicotinate phosphoribosyltransferase